MEKVLLKQQNQLKQLRTRCERIRPDRQIELEADRLAGLQQRLKRAIIGRLEVAEQEQLRLKERSQALDPALVLMNSPAPRHSKMASSPLSLIAMAGLSRYPLNPRFGRS